MSIPQIQDDIVPIAEIADDAARFDLALRAHPAYRNVPQVHIQATVNFRGARPLATTFAAALLATFFARSARPEVALYVLGGALVIGSLGWLGVFLSMLVLLGVQQKLELTELVWCAASIVTLYLCRDRTFTVVIPPSFEGLSEWDELTNGVKVMFGGENRIKRGSHTIGYAAYTLLSAAPFCALGLLSDAVGDVSGPLIVLGLGLALPRFAIAATASSDDLVLLCTARGFDPAAEANFTANRTNIVAVVSALAVLTTMHIAHIPALGGH